MAKLPLWLSDERKGILANLLLECAYNNYDLKVEESTGYLYYIEYREALAKLVPYWITDDKDRRSYEHKITQYNFHRLNEKGKVKGSFNAISKDIYFGNQPQYYFERYGTDIVNFHRIAVIRLASTFTRLHIDISAPLRLLSKNRKRKIRRYGKGLPLEIERMIEAIIRQSVKGYLASN